MKFFISVAIAISMTFGSTSGFAGNIRGNGGGVIVCRDNDHNIKSAELLDIYEARELRQMELDFGPAETDYLSKVRYVLEKRKDVAPVRAILWQGWADSFESEARRLTGVELDHLDDSLIPAWPAGCKVEQIVIQQELNFPEDKRYIVNQDLWNALNEENRASLILHEVIYREAISFGQKTSVSTRYINSVWSSKGTPNALSNQRSLNDLFKKSGFKVGEWRGTAPVLYACEVYQGRIRFYNEPLKPIDPLEFYSSFYTTGFFSLHTSTTQFSIKLQRNLHQICEARPIGHLSTDGKIESLQIFYSQTARGEVAIQNQSLKFDAIKKNTSASSQDPIRITTNTNFQKLEGLNGKKYSHSTGPEKYAQLWFNEDLKVVSCERCIEE